VSKESRSRAVQQARQAQARALRRRWLVTGGVAVAVIAAAVGGTLAATSGGSSGGSSPVKLAALSTLGNLQPAPAPGANGAESVPVPAGAPLAGTAAIVTGKAVDGIACNTSEQLVYHIHAHLTIIVNGTPRQVPAGIGIPGAVAAQTPAGPFIESGSCIYWLHTHAPDGIIHVESPAQRTYTLGDFFDEWGQPLSATQVGPAKGHVTALYNGQVYTGNPRNIPLSAHAQIQLEVGTPLVAPEKVAFPNGL
jgi:hypothetical protein